MKKVVAISRAIGAEGEFIGTLVAEKLGYRYVDEEIIADAAEKQGVDPAAIADAERRKGVLLRVIEGFGQSGAANATATPGGPMWIPDDSSELVRSHDLRALIRETVVETAGRGDVVIVAHAASFALGDRDDVLRVLVVAVALTMALAYFTGAPILWGVQLLADVCLLAFLGLWAWARSLQADRAEKVRFLPQRGAPEFALRRTASS